MCLKILVLTANNTRPAQKVGDIIYALNKTRIYKSLRGWICCDLLRFCQVWCTVWRPQLQAEPASQGLHLEEYFHTESSSSLVEDADGNRVAEELPWNRSSNPSKYKWCSHVDPFLLNGSAILLQARCGLGDYRPADGFGLVTGFSTSGGRFVYDGLVTTVDRWFRPHFLKLRRFRFVGNAAVGPAGDVRVFMLSPSLPGSETPTVAAWPRKHSREGS